MLQTSDNVCLGYFLHVLLVLPILSPERKGNFILFSNAQDCKCYYWDFLFSAPFQYILASAKCIKYEQQRADFCHIKHSVLFYAFCISRAFLFTFSNRADSDSIFCYKSKNHVFPFGLFSLFTAYFTSQWPRRFEF